MKTQLSINFLRGIIIRGFNFRKLNDFEFFVFKRKRSYNLVIGLISLLFFLLFLYAGLSALFHSEQFYGQMSRLPVLGNYAGILRWLVPVSEFLICILLIRPGQRRFGLYGCLALMTLFSVYIMLMLNFSPVIPCSCSSVLSAWNWEEQLTFNVVGVILAATGVCLLCVCKHSDY
nr:MauE/DoxX family redox-associated membrane protein [Pedobacter sp. ASV19]